MASFNYNYNYSSPYVAPTFSFVPTTSALDIENFNAVNAPYFIPTTGLNGSRAANFIAQENIALPPPVGIVDNVNHTDFFARTCTWLYNEMENLPQPAVTCNDYCASEVSVSIAPSTLEILCGDETSKTFAANEMGIIPGTIDRTHTWALGANNGWLYQGNPAPANINTGVDNSIILTPICGQQQSSLAVTVATNCISLTANNTVTNVAANPNIAAPNTICSATIPTLIGITDLPCDATVTWSTAPAGVINLSTLAGNTTNATINTFGNATITANISSVICGNVTKTVQVKSGGRQLNIGSYTQPYNYFSPKPFQTYTIFSGVPPSIPIDLTIDGSPTFGSFYVNNSSFPPNTTLLNTNTMRIFTSSGSHTITGSVFTYNECGVKISNTFYMDLRNYGRAATNSNPNFEVSPNPAANRLQVSASKNALTVNNNKVAFTSIYVYDKMGIMRQQINYPRGTSSAIINIANLPNDTYVLKIFDGINWEEHKFLVIK